MYLELKRIKENNDDSNDFNNYGEYLTKHIEKLMSNNNRMFQFDSSHYNSYTNFNYKDMIDTSISFLRKNLEKYTTELVLSKSKNKNNYNNSIKSYDYTNDYCNFDSEIKIIKNEISKEKFFNYKDNRLILESGINFKSSYDNFFRTHSLESLDERIKGNTYYEPFATYINKTKMGCVDFIYFNNSDDSENIQVSKILSYPFVKDIINVDFNNLMEFPSDHIPLSVNLKIC